MTDIHGVREEHQITQARGDLSALTRAAVLPFLDRNKLVRSSTFAGVVEMTIAQFIRTGNTGYVNQLVALLRSSKHEKAILQFFCARAGLEVSICAGEVHLVKSDAQPDSSRQLAEFFPQAAEARAEDLVTARFEARIASGELRVEKASLKRKADLLDSKARLPGSFGSGKRR